MLSSVVNSCQLITFRHLGGKLPSDLVDWLLKVKDRRYSHIKKDLSCRSEISLICSGIPTLKELILSHSE